MKKRPSEGENTISVPSFFGLNFDNGC